jgi:(p)ppGpp synthase/HD superfamily hydrolase
MTWLESVATARFLDALSFALEVHGRDRRKGTGVPYFGHLLSVCGLVLKDEGTEDEAIAALLHDTLEDHPATVTSTDLSQRFGNEVLVIVQGCTDTPPEYKGGPKPPWRERKLAYLEHLRHARQGVLRVALADKLDNARSMLADYRLIRETLWSRFNAGKQDQLWFLVSLVEAFQIARPPGQLLVELKSTVAELERLTTAA